ncbi:hypothetical protein M948_18200 [Virgibacillus sp. CM-4]|nr:hypothetical protein M948_18200 [Virgibacillus sp. CM-4]
METWKPIEGHSYEISNHGRVRNRNTRKVIRVDVTDHSYARVKLNNSRHKVHRLVGLYFISNPDNKKEINHKDGNKINNHVDNLEWVNGEENIKHAINEGLIITTDNNIVSDIYLSFKKGIDKKEIIKRHKVSRQMVDNIISKRRHRKFTDKLDLKIIS